MRVALLGLLLVLSGCAHTFVIEKGAPAERYGEAREFLHQDQPAELILTTGKTFTATDLYIGSDTTVFRIEDATDLVIMMNDRIRSITTHEKSNNARTGALIGGFGGGVVGLIVGTVLASMNNVTYVSSSSDCDCGPSSREDDDIIILSSVGIGALSGSFLGAVLGSQTVSFRTLEFYRDHNDPRRWEYLPR